MSGEWSSLSGANGKHRFYYRRSDDGCYWALLSEGFPNRVIAVAHSPLRIRVENVTGAMLRAVSEAGGDSIDLEHAIGEGIDGDLLWAAAYERK